MPETRQKAKASAEAAEGQRVEAATTAAATEVTPVRETVDVEPARETADEVQVREAAGVVQVREVADMEPAGETAGVVRVRDNTGAVLMSERSFSQTGSAASSIRRRKAAAQMEQLEAEKAIKLERLKIEQDFIERKYRLMEQQLDEEENEAKSVSNKSDRVTKWMAANSAEKDDEVKNSNKYAADPPEMSEECGDITREIRRMRANLNRSRSATPEAGVPSDGVQKPTWTLSKEQRAARQSLPRDLPIFAGDPAEWPTFISSFNLSTEACGYQLAENLIRLQRCLKGAAREAVHGRLLLPSSVPSVINALKRRFGRPELLLDELLERVRKTPPPRADNLESLVAYGEIAQTLCAHVQAAGMKEHLRNPMLIAELVEKLPSEYRMSWARLVRGGTPATLNTLATFLDDLTEDAISVTRIRNPQPKGQEKRGPRKERLCTHTTSGSELPELKAKRAPCGVCHKTGHSATNCWQLQALAVEERWKTIQQAQLCTHCLKQHKEQCRFQMECPVEGCAEQHHPLLHRPATVSTNRAHSASHSATHSPMNRATIFRTVPVVCHNGDERVEAVAFIDEGSSTSVIEEELANRLGLKGRLQPLSLQWTANITRDEESSRRVSFRISAVHGRELFAMNDVATVKKLDLPAQPTSKKEMQQEYEHLRNLPLDNNTRLKPDLLIGLDHLRLVVPLEIVEGGKAEPIAARTRLGWCVYGGKVGCQMFNHSDTPEINSGGPDEHSDEALHQMMKEYFAVDSWGAAKGEVKLAARDERAQHLLETLTKLREGRYETGLLWKQDNVQLPESRTMAMNRFLELEKRLQKDSPLKVALDQKMQSYMENGYSRRVTKEELEDPPLRIWYLPIFPVSNPNKPNKVRLVWDAAAKSCGTSLNAQLLKGPDQLSSLFEVLIRFRERSVGLTGDIREMFHQVLIRAEDQHCQRFFWRSPAGNLEEYVLRVMSFGASCSPSSAQFIKNKNADRFLHQLPEAVEVIKRLHYVDDMLVSVDTPEQAIRLAKDVKCIHSQGGFNIRNWITNSPPVREALTEDHVDEKSLDLAPTELPVEKVLGMWWRTDCDTLSYKINWGRYGEGLLKGRRRPTKREMLKVLMSVFDPLGLIAHYLMYLKVLLQEVWRSGVDWDQEVNDECYEKWSNWVKHLPRVEGVRVPRCYGTTVPPEGCEVHLHVFVDASEDGMAAVCYLQMISESATKCNIVAAKTKVAPLKHLSIPRMELQAALIGARLAQTVTRTISFRIHQRHYWTDSQDVLQWINSDHRKYSSFVACRISEILDATEAQQWRWVPSKQNVADDATKWEKNPDLSPTSRWFVGPEFIWGPEAEWPKKTDNRTEEKIELEPMLLVQSIEKPESLVEYNRFSKLKHLLNTIACVWRFIDNCKRKRVGETRVKYTEPYNQTEFSRAERTCFILAQSETYPRELSLLKASQPLRKDNAIYQLNPWIDEQGVLRMRGRTTTCNAAAEGAKNPVILNRNHPVTELIMADYHERYHHQNHATVINEIRQKFYVSRLRAAYSRMRSNCQRCKNDRARPAVPTMSDLPEARVAAFCQPFTHTGVDFFGPMEVAVGRRVEKRWGLLATCLTTRAVHIEIAHSLSTSSCIMALQNFTARRGVPSHIHSDRGTNFVGASKLLNVEDVSRGFVGPNTSWSFIPPSSPHMGGSWERLIRNVKSNLRAVMPSRKPTDEILRNSLIEVENIINSRPLTHVAVEEDAPEALTPNHFLLGSSDGRKLFGYLADDGDALLRNWRTAQYFAECYWHRWVREYLPEINRRTKWHEEARSIKIGDIVVICDSDSPRNQWPLGRVTKTHESRDGRVRSASVRTIRGEYDRPVAKLAVLDVYARKGNQSQMGDDVRSGYDRDRK